MDVLAPSIVMGLVLLTLLLCLTGPTLLESVAARRSARTPDTFAHVPSGGGGPRRRAFEPHLWANRTDAEEGLL